jgi:hypothetical protein
MLMHLGHDCHCKQPFPDCFYCPVFETNIPEQWVMDMPSSLSYLGATSGSCSTTTPINDDVTTYTAWSMQYEYPDVAGFGTETPLNIDDAPRRSIYTPITECIWGSSGYVYYEEVGRGVVPWGTSGCSLGVAAVGEKKDDMPIDDCWEYTSYGGTVPPFYSLGRTRTDIPFTFPNCGAMISGCTPERSCGIRPFGIWAVLQIVKPFSSPAKFSVLVWWFPRCLYTRTNYIRLSSTTWGVTTGSSRWTEQLAPDGSPSSCISSLYPYSTSINNVSGPGGILYEKVIDCDTDFTGSPVVLPLVGATRKSSASTQNVFEAAGITGLPSSITITPV